MNLFQFRAAASAGMALWMLASSFATELGIEESRFTIAGKPAFLLGMSYYGGLGASEDFIKRDLEDLQRDGFNWIRVWATWGAFDNDVSAVTGEGAPREPFLGRLRKLVEECDRRGMVVDVTLSRQNGAIGPPRLLDLDPHRRAVETLVENLRGSRNWYLDLANERSVKDARFVSHDELRQLRQRVRELDQKRIVTASHSSSDDDFLAEFEAYLKKSEVDFLAPHRPRDARSTGQTEAMTRRYREKMRELGRVVPVHYQEPFRRGFAKWEPEADDFFRDLRGAIKGGAAGWCFHNGPEGARPDKSPRRSFDLRQKRLYDQLDEIELAVVRRVNAVMREAQAELKSPR